MQKILPSICIAFAIQCNTEENYIATDQISIRIDHATKAAAEDVFDALGLSPTDAVRMFYKQVAMHHGLPFPATIPNAETIAAIRQLDAAGGKKMTLAEFKRYLKP